MSGVTFREGFTGGIDDTIAVGLETKEKEERTRSSKNQLLSQV